MRRNSIVRRIGPLVAIALSGSTLGESTRQVSITPIPEIQDKIAAIVHGQSTDQIRRNTIELVFSVEESDEDASQMLEQLVHYFATKHFNPEALLAAMIVGRMGLHPSVKTQTLIPLMGSDDHRVREIVKLLLSTVDFRGARPGPNYEWYESYIHDHKDDLPPAFVRYMYAHAPGEALLCFNRQFQSGDDVVARRQVKWAEHVVSQWIWMTRNGFDGKAREHRQTASTELKMLGAHEGWWARLYVVHIVARHRKIQNAELVKTLKEDRNQIVRDAANEKL